MQVLHTIGTGETRRGSGYLAWFFEYCRDVFSFGYSVLVALPEAFKLMKSSTTPAWHTAQSSTSILTFPTICSSVSNFSYSIEL